MEFLSNDSFVSTSSPWVASKSLDRNERNVRNYQKTALWSQNIDNWNLLLLHSASSVNYLDAGRWFTALSRDSVGHRWSIHCVRRLLINATIQSRARDIYAPRNLQLFALRELIRRAVIRDCHPRRKLTDLWRGMIKERGLKGVWTGMNWWYGARWQWREDCQRVKSKGLSEVAVRGSLIFLTPHALLISVLLHPCRPRVPRTAALGLSCKNWY